jgi:hypothetical protein
MLKLLLPTLGLSLLLVVLLLYWDQVRTLSVKTSRQAEEKLQAKPALTFEPANVKAFRIRNGQKLLFAARMNEDRTWLLESPFQAPADAYAVDRALTILSSVKTLRPVATEAASLTDFGLEAPPIFIELEEDAGLQWLAVGKASPRGDSYYARSSQSNEVVLVPQKEIRLLPQNPSELLDLRVVPLIQDPLHTIEVRQGAVSIRLQATTDGWTIQAPIRAAADRHVMSEWLFRLTALRASTVNPKDAWEGRRAEFSRLGTMRLAAGNVGQSVEFFRAGGVLLARRSDHPSLWYELAGQDASVLLPDVFSLRDKHLIIGIEPRSVMTLEIQHNNHHVERLVRQRQGWKLNEQQLSSNQAQSVERWLSDLNLSQWSELLGQPARCSIGAAGRKEIVLRGRTGQVLDSLNIARTQACGDVATTSRGEWVRLQDAGLIDQLPGRRFHTGVGARLDSSVRR